MHTASPQPDLAGLGRLRVLADLDLDNPQLRARLNVIAERTANRLGQPVSLISLVTDLAQFFPGSYGLDGWLAEVEGTPAEWSFCARMVETRAPYVVPDTVNDRDQATNPLVTDDGVASYAGVPIVVDGEVLGAHCVLGKTPHDYTDEEMAELTRGAEEIVALLEEYLD
ncbi:MAG: GAF domain-containing protein [Actinoplanes sp.]